MSIINDAIKKATKKSTKGNLLASTYVSPEKKWTRMWVLFSVFIVFLVGMVSLYKRLSGPNAVFDSAQSKTKEDVTIAFGQTHQEKMFFPAIKPKDIVELNGVVYGDEDKWAIINNNIVREGDLLLNGRLTLIAKDSVKIKKATGEEVVLNLR